MRYAERALLMLFIFTFLTLSNTWAQENSSSNDETLRLIDQVRKLGIDSLNIGRTTVHFTPGYKDRAERLGAQINQQLDFFRDSLGAELKGFHLILINKNHWKQVTKHQPYGVPKSLGAWQRDNLGKEVAKNTPLEPPSALVPADAKGGVFEELLKMENCITPQYKKHLETLGFAWKEAAVRYVEMITFHEVSHLITDTDAYKIKMPTSWYREFLANYLGYLYLYNKHPKSSAIWDLMTAITFECYTPKYRTLEELVIYQIDAADYHWFQSNWIQQANRVVENHGFEFIRKAKKIFSEEDSLLQEVDAVYNNLNALSKEEATQRLENINKEMIERLEQIAPGFQKWATIFKRQSN